MPTSLQLAVFRGRVYLQLAMLSMDPWREVLANLIKGKGAKS